MFGRFALRLVLSGAQLMIALVLTVRCRRWPRGTAHDALFGRARPSDEHEVESRTVR